MRPYPRLALAFAFALTIPASVAMAQTDAIKRTVLQRLDVVGEAKEVVMAVIDIPAKSDSPRQTHPGEEVGYLIAGDLTLKIDGQPVRTIGPGGSFTVARGVKHSTSTLGGAKLLAIWTVDKGAPLATNID